MRPATLAELAAEHGMQVPVVSGFGSFTVFAEMYLTACDVLQRPEDMVRLVDETADDAVAAGAVYIEPAIYLPHHRERLGPPEELLELLLDASRAASRAHRRRDRLDGVGRPHPRSVRRRRAGPPGRPPRRQGRGVVRSGQRRAARAARAASPRPSAWPATPGSSPPPTPASSTGPTASSRALELLGARPHPARRAGRRAGGTGPAPGRHRGLPRRLPDLQRAARRGPEHRGASAARSCSRPGSDSRSTPTTRCCSGPDCSRSTNCAARPSVSATSSWPASPPPPSSAAGPVRTPRPRRSTASTSGSRRRRSEPRPGAQVKPAPFTYLDPPTLDGVLAALAEHGDDAAVISGGQSLVPLMNLRLARPDVVVDPRRVPGLRDIAVADDAVVIGAMVTASELLEDPAVASGPPRSRRGGGVHRSFPDPQSHHHGRFGGPRRPLGRASRGAGRRRGRGRAGIGAWRAQGGSRRPVRRLVQHHPAARRTGHRGALPDPAGRHRLGRGVPSSGGLRPGRTVRRPAPRRRRRRPGPPRPLRRRRPTGAGDPGPRPR